MKMWKSECPHLPKETARAPHHPHHQPYNLKAFRNVHIAPCKPLPSRWQWQWSHHPSGQTRPPYFTIHPISGEYYISSINIFIYSYEGYSYIHTYVYSTFLFIYVIVINNKKFNFINYVITINIIRFGICIIGTKLCRHDASSAQHISRTVGDWRWMRWMWRITLYQNHHVNARTHKLKHILCSPAAQNQQLLYLLLYSTLIYKFWG